jgi:hypothetical protein
MNIHPQYITQKPTIEPVDIQARLDLKNSNNSLNIFIGSRFVNLINNYSNYAINIKVVIDYNYFIICL